MRGDTLRTSTVQTVTKPNLNEALFVARDLPTDHPDVLADRRFRSANRWPAGLPGFRETSLSTIATRWSGWCRRWCGSTPARSTCRQNTSTAPFEEPQYKLRMTHYPHQVTRRRGRVRHCPAHRHQLPHPACAQRRAGPLDPHAKRQLDRRAGHYDAYVVNGGQMLQRWTNDCFLATPHRAVNRSGGERYALPFFCDSNIDWPIAAVPTTRRAGQAAEIPDDLLHRLHGRISEAELRCVPR